MNQPGKFKRLLPDYNAVQAPVTTPKPHGDMNMIRPMTSIYQHAEMQQQRDPFAKLHELFSRRSGDKLLPRK